MIHVHQTVLQRFSKMGKETQLLEAAAAGNNTKVEQFLKGRQSRLKRFLSSERLLGSTPEDEEADTTPPLKITDKRQPVNIDIEYRDESGSSALHLAVLNGHRDVVYTLLQFSADVYAMDNQGNTPLHFAGWHNRSDIVELLLVNGARADIANRAGYTPLHYACQYCPVEKTFTIIKLLQYHAGILVPNQAGDTPFDLAVRFNKKEAVSLLVDAEPSCLRQTKSIIEAAKNGRSEIVEILLEAGMDPNCFDGTSESCPMHEAVRYFRKDVVRVLLEFGADSLQPNAKGESPRDIAMAHPEVKREEFLQLFEEFRGVAARIPRVYREQAQDTVKTDHTVITYPLLNNKPEWTKSEADYCSAWTKQHPNTCLLDNDSNSYWKIPAAGAYNWVAFDLGSEYTLTGLRIAGWGDKQMVHMFFVETAKALSGPWRQVGKYKADLIGPEDMSEGEPAETQDFRGFYETSRYWRLMIADNYGDPTTCLAEVQFFGVETGVVEWFERLELKQHLKGFVQKGFNQLSELAMLTERDLYDITDLDDQRKLLHASQLLKQKFCKPKNLTWAIPPVNNIHSNKVLPEIAVCSDAYTVGQLEIVALYGGELHGRTVQPLVMKENGYLSKATFRGLTISPAGQFVLEVHSVDDPTVTLRSPERINVAPPPMRQSEIGQVFDDLDEMLKFDF